MTVSWSEYGAFMREQVATGYITGFTVDPLGITQLNYTATGSGSTAGQRVTVKPKDRLIVASRINDGLVFRSDGSIFNPWGLAGSRAPAHYPQYTQRFLYTGHVALVQQTLERFLGRVGYTGLIHFSYGRLAGDTYGAKSCEGMLLSVSGATDQNMDHTQTTLLTAIEVTATWQQTGAFTP
jgi:hypothetical protein